LSAAENTGFDAVNVVLVIAEKEPPTMVRFVALPAEFRTDRSKLSFTLTKAARRVSPVPSLALVPTPMVANAARAFGANREIAVRISRK
jgi:hypothetical protein